MKQGYECTSSCVVFYLNKIGIAINDYDILAYKNNIFKYRRKENIPDFDIDIYNATLNFFDNQNIHYNITKISPEYIYDFIEQIINDNSLCLFHLDSSRLPYNKVISKTIVTSHYLMVERIDRENRLITVCDTCPPIYSENEYIFEFKIEDFKKAWKKFNFEVIIVDKFDEIFIDKEKARKELLYTLSMCGSKLYNKLTQSGGYAISKYKKELIQCLKSWDEEEYFINCRKVITNLSINGIIPYFQIIKNFFVSNIENIDCAENIETLNNIIKAWKNIVFNVSRLSMCDDTIRERFINNIIYNLDIVSEMIDILSENHSCYC